MNINYNAADYGTLLISFPLHCYYSKYLICLLSFTCNFNVLITCTNGITKPNMFSKTKV